jgi:hypothetical protein
MGLGKLTLLHNCSNPSNVNGAVGFGLSPNENEDDVSGLSDLVLPSSTGSCCLLTSCVLSVQFIPRSFCNNDHLIHVEDLPLDEESEEDVMTKSDFTAIICKREIPFSFTYRAQIEFEGD